MASNSDAAKGRRTAHEWSMDNAHYDYSESIVTLESICFATKIPETFLMLRPTEYSDGTIVWYPTRDAIRGELERCGQYDHDDEEEAERLVEQLFNDLTPVLD